MGLTRIAAPAIQPVTLADAKAALNVTGPADDSYIEMLIGSAVTSLDGLYGALGRCLISQNYRLTLSGFGAEIRLPLPPHIGVDAVKYLDAAGTEQTLPAPAYRVIGVGTLGGARIVPSPGTLWPNTFNDTEAVTVDFRAGFGVLATDVPADLRRALLAMVASLYAARESVWLGTGTPATMPDFAAVIARYRVSDW